jgi:hypothetical protein
MRDKERNNDIFWAILHDIKYIVTADNLTMKNGPKVHAINAIESLILPLAANNVSINVFIYSCTLTACYCMQDTPAVVTLRDF